MKTLLSNEKIYATVYLLKSKYPDLTKFDKRFNFAASRTIANLQPIVNDILEARKSSIPRFNEFEQKRIAIVTSCANIDSNGVIQSFKSEEDKNRGQEELNKLSEEYKDALDERQKEMNMYNEILSQEVEVDIIQCKFEALPTDFNFGVLRLLVKESDEEIEALL